VWWAMHRDPRHVTLTAEETAYLTEGDTTGHAQRATFADWRRLFAYSTTWGMVAGFFGTIYVTWIYTAWLPFYLEHERHISVGKTGFLAAIPFFWGVVGGVLGGFIVDWMVRRGFSPMNSRKYPMVASLVGIAIFTALTAVAPSNTLALVFISCAMFMAYVSSTTAWATASVAAPSNCTASIGAIQNFGGYFGGALAPLVTGIIVQKTGSFSPALYTGAAICLVSAALYALLVGKPITLDQDEAMPGRALAGD
jgi:MFS family permease